MGMATWRLIQLEHFLQPTLTYFVEDIRVAILAGYAGLDILEVLMKMKLKDKFLGGALGNVFDEKDKEELSNAQFFRQLSSLIPFFKRCHFENWVNNLIPDRKKYLGLFKPTLLKAFATWILYACYTILNKKVNKMPRNRAVIIVWSKKYCCLAC